MKKHLFAFFVIAALIFMTACGQSNEEPQEKLEDIQVEESSRPDVTIQPEIVDTKHGIEAPDETVGTWISVNNNRDTVIITAEGLVKINDIELYIEEVKDDNGKSSIVCIPTGLQEQKFNNVINLYLEDGFLAMVDENEKPILDNVQTNSQELFYIQGTENPIHAFWGEWTLCNGDGFAWNGSLVYTFTISENGTLEIGETKTEIRYSKETKQDCIYWAFQDNKDTILPNFIDPDNLDAYELTAANGSWGTYYKDVKVARLTPENVFDFFETTQIYFVTRNNSGDFEDLHSMALLVPHANIRVLNVKDGHVTTTRSPKDYAYIHYDLDKDEYYYTEMSVDEFAEYEAYIWGLGAYPARNAADFINADDYWDAPYAVIGRSWHSRTNVENNTVIASAVRNSDTEVNTITGTIYYQDMG